MKALTIDTTTPTLILGLFFEDELVDSYITESKNNHGSMLMPCIEQLLTRNNLTAQQLTKIIVSNGPGSYTGTRIGVTTAKTLGWALQIPVYPISSLYMYGIAFKDFPGLICPLIDARRKSVYTSLFTMVNNELIEVEQEQYISIEDWLKTIQLNNQKLLFISPNMNDLREYFPSNEAMLFENIKPSPKYLFNAAQAHNDVQSVHEITPNYIRVTEAERNLMKQEKEKHND